MNRNLGFRLASAVINSRFTRRTTSRTETSARAMTASEAGPEPRTTSTVARVLLGILAVSEALVGGWALFAPASFYRSFPAAGHGWVALLPPYNEHLIRDVGSLSLALTLVLAAAAVTGQSLLSAVAVGAFAVYAVPHMIFHSFHLEGFSVADAVAQTVGFVLQLLAAGVVTWLLWRDRAQTR